MPEDAFQSLAESPTFSWDIETLVNPGVPDCVENATNPTLAYIEAMSCTTRDGTWDWEVPYGADPFQGIGNFFFDKSKFCLVWNWMMEGSFFYHRFGGFPDCAVFDGMIGMKLVDEYRFSYELKQTAGDLLGMQMMQYEEYARWKQSLLPEAREMCQKYRQDDAIATWELCKEEIVPKLKKEDLLRYYFEVEAPAIQANIQSWLVGCRVDIKHLEEQKRLLYDVRHNTGRIPDLEKQIYELAGQSFKVTSGKQLSYILYNKLGIDPKKYSSKWNKSGYYGADKNVLKRMEDDGVLIAAALNEYRKCKKEYTSTYSPLLRKLKSATSRRFGFINFQAKLHKQTTGRMSYSPSVTTIFPRPDKSTARKAIRARKGFKLIVRDLSQAELRMMAHMSQDPDLSACYTPGNSVDVHTKTSIACGFEPGDKQGRQVAKSINFGTIYRMGPHTFVATLFRETGIKMEVEVAKKLLRVFLETYPEVKRYHQACEDYIMKNRKIMTLMGRVRHFGDELFNRKESYSAISSGINHTIQGSVADIMKMAMGETEVRLTAEGVWAPDQCHLLFQAHDELVCEAPEDIAHDCSLVIKDVMENIVTLDVPLVSEGGVCDNWYQGKDL